MQSDNTIENTQDIMLSKTELMSFMQIGQMLDQIQKGNYKDEKEYILNLYEESQELFRNFVISLYELHKLDYINTEVYYQVKHTLEECEVRCDWGFIPPILGEYFEDSSALDIAYEAVKQGTCKFYTYTQKGNILKDRLKSNKNANSTYTLTPELKDMLERMFYACQDTTLLDTVDETMTDFLDNNYLSEASWGWRDKFIRLEELGLLDSDLKQIIIETCKDGNWTMTDTCVSDMEFKGLTPLGMAYLNNHDEYKRLCENTNQFMQALKKIDDGVGKLAEKSNIVKLLVGLMSN